MLGVSSWEGKQIGSLLEPLIAEPWCVEPHRPKIGPGGNDSPDQQSQIDGADREAPADEAAQQQPAEPAKIESPPRPEVLSERPSDNPIATVRMETLVASLPQQPDDTDLIVFDEEPRIAPARPRPTPDVRKLEYKQLFAKLRRG